MTDHAQVVIIGGGIIGCSIAYHLTKAGWRDVLIVEKGQETSGSTWHAAGLVGQLRASRNVTRMLTYSVDCYRTLEEITGQATGWKQVGSLRLASSKDRMLELKRSATMAKSFGLEMHLLSPKQALELFPIMSIEGVYGAAFLPTDGYIDPSSVALALAKGARDGGARILRHTRVIGIDVKDGTATRIRTEQGEITADIVVNAAGMWAREIGAMAGVNVPLIPVQHHYIVTESIPGMPTGLPTMRDPDLLVYYKEDSGGLVMGGYEPDPVPWSVNGIPKEFGQQLLEPDTDHFEQISLLALQRTPILEKVGIKRFINGPEAFTPDGYFIMGRAPELKNFFVAAGFNAHGIASGGGAGRMMAEWIMFGEPSIDLWRVDIRRFGTIHRSTEYVRDRTVESYGRHYSIAWPYEESEAARGVRKSPLHQTLKDKGAVYGEKFGWERVNWFAPQGTEQRDTLCFGRANWFEHVGKEHQAIREGVVLIDQTPFSKLEVHGKDALQYLQWLAANNIDKPAGSLTYTQLCNERGGIECDLTIARLGEEHFYITTGTAFGDHDLTWINYHSKRFGQVVAYEVTSGRAVINVCGPLSRNLLSKVCSNNLSNEGFAFGQCREIRIGYAPVLALRVTYVGELGWELHIPTEYASYAYDRLWEAGQEFGVKDAGYRAIESCRLEKGYRYWSTDITPDYNPYEAGLGFCVALKKGDFLGREALIKVKKEGIKKKLCCFTLAEPRQIYGGETISRAGKTLSVVTSGGFGYTIDKTIAYGYLPIEETRHADFEIEVMGEALQATQHEQVLYDPKRERILR